MTDTEKKIAKIREALENGNKVCHICGNHEDLQSQSSQAWWNERSEHK